MTKIGYNIKVHCCSYTLEQGYEAGKASNGITFIQGGPKM